LLQATVAKYMVRQRRPPSQMWRTFLRNHMKDTVAADFTVVPTVFFVLFLVIEILSHDCRRVIQFGVTGYLSLRRTRRSFVAGQIRTNDIFGGDNCSSLGQTSRSASLC
jgi:hypothetical protein